MTAEFDLSVTANRPHKLTWERFIPETPISVDDPKVQEFVILKTWWDTYLRASTSGTVDANSVERTVQSYLYKNSSLIYCL
jgi:hypothetical protein